MVCGPWGRNLENSAVIGPGADVGAGTIGGVYWVLPPRTFGARFGIKMVRAPDNKQHARHLPAARARLAILVRVCGDDRAECGGGSDPGGDAAVLPELAARLGGERSAQLVIWVAGFGMIVGGMFSGRLLERFGCAHSRWRRS